MKKKVNPRRVPASKADVQKAKKQAISEAVEIAFAILLSALRDKEGFGYTRLRRVWSEAEYISDSIDRGYVKVADLIKELADHDIILKGGSGNV